jgi:hypothetical protein
MTKGKKLAIGAGTGLAAVLLGVLRYRALKVGDNVLASVQTGQTQSHFTFTVTGKGGGMLTVVPLDLTGAPAGFVPPGQIPEGAVIQNLTPRLF